MLPELKTGIPGPRSRELIARLKRYESRNVTFASDHFPIFWEHASGANVWDADGNRFLDLTSAFAVAGLGHNDPAIREAMTHQAERLIHAMGDVHPTREKADLCQLLSEITFERWNCGTARTLLANSGSEAVEAALKTALMATGKPGVVSFTGGYHGLGHGALETIGIARFRDPFASQLATFGVQVPFPASPEARLDELRDEIEAVFRRRDIGAILVEPIQGRGGEVVPPPAFLPMLREICNGHGVLLVLDEIFTGFNRTGRLFACEHSGVVPDIICLGKALTSGFPLSACVAKREVMDAWPPSTGEALHTSTFLGNPVGCAMAIASVREHLRPETQAAAQAASESLTEALGTLKSPRAGPPRGIGVMRGIELIRPDGSPDAKLAAAVVVRALRDGILLLAGSPDGNVLSLTPPFCITREEVTFAIGKIQEYMTSLPGSIS